MQKSRGNPDLSVTMEVTDWVRSTFRQILEEAISHRPSFDLQYQLSEFERKYVDLNTDSPEVRYQRATEKWLGVEARNAKTNVRLFSTDPTFWDGTTGWRILLKASRIIRKVLGELDINEVLLTGSFTGGATTSKKRGAECLASKYQGELDVTPECWDYVREIVHSHDTWVSYNPLVLTPRLVKGNILFTVPKTAVIDRVCCKEPDLNIYFQKSVGNYIRRRMRLKTGCDLNDQARNRNLARLGSVDGSLATIDLSSASDSLSDNLVRILMPAEWYQLLDALRCRKTFIKDGKEMRSKTLSMFSSMGNGFTFELESLVFWALARATQLLSKSTGIVSVYGDDIIVPTRIAARVINVLRWCGFSTNVDKTFRRGPFRESCGGHYHGGLDVTPFYLRRPFKDVSDLILFTNQLRAWIIRVEADSLYEGWLTPNPFVRFWYSLRELIPKSLRGGWDTSSRAQLASPDPAYAELVLRSRELVALRDDFSLGGYLSRLDTLVKRLEEGDAPIQTHEETISKLVASKEASGDLFVVPTTKYVIRRVKIRAYVFGLECPLFLTEQLSLYAP